MKDPHGLHRDARLLAGIYSIPLDDAEALLRTRGWDRACAALDAMQGCAPVTADLYPCAHRVGRPKA